MDNPVHRYRGYDILCSASGYTVMKGDVEVLSVGTGDAGSELADCATVDHFLPQAQHAIDQLIDE